MIQREEKRSRLAKKFLEKRNTLKAELKTTTDYEVKVKLLQKLDKLPKNSAPSRGRNRCWMTGRSRGFYKDFGLSRHVLREMAHEGLIPGLQKSSW